MFLSNPAKIFLTGFILLSIFGGSGCRQKVENTDTGPTADPEVLPFSTTEPETFQAEIVVSAGGVEQRTFVARSGRDRRTDYDLGGHDRLTLLETDKKYLISDRSKIFAQDELPVSSGDGFDDSMATVLAAREYAEFKKIGVENGLTKFRASPPDSDSSEVMIYVDESLGLPVKQEYFSINGDQRTLEYSVELTNIRREIDAGVFEIPPGFRQTSIDEFRKLTARR